MSLKKESGQAVLLVTALIVWTGVVLNTHQVYSKNNARNARKNDARMKKSQKHSTSGKHYVKTITAADLNNLINTDESVTVINVLSPQAFEQCRIAKSINIPGDELQEKTKDWDRNKNIIVYCASYKCTASKNAYKTLQKLGFTNITEYAGGIKEWREMNLPTEGTCPK